MLRHQELTQRPVPTTSPGGLLPEDLGGGVRRASASSVFRRRKLI